MANKARFELRFDDELVEGLKKLAAEAGVSVNQLMQGISRWVLDHAQVGEAMKASRFSSRFEPKNEWRNWL